MSNEYWVTSLTYELEPCKSVKFVDCPPLEFVDETGTFRLADGVVVVSLNEKTFDSLQVAKKDVEAVLLAWSVKSRLNDWLSVLTFKYSTSHVVPKIPPKGGDIVFAEATVTEIVGHAPSFILTCREYPAAPTDFRMSADVETLWGRYDQYVSGRELLQSMTYFISTFLSGCSDQRQYFSASKEVRKTLRVLSSWKGDKLTGRKAHATVPLSPKETEWLKVTVRELIRRTGQYAAGIQLKPLQMSDLPPLS